MLCRNAQREPQWPLPRRQRLSSLEHRFTAETLRRSEIRQYLQKKPAQDA